MPEAAQLVRAEPDSRPGRVASGSLVLTTSAATLGEKCDLHSPFTREKERHHTWTSFQCLPLDGGNSRGETSMY